MLVMTPTHNRYDICTLPLCTDFLNSDICELKSRFLRIMSFKYDESDKYFTILPIKCTGVMAL